MAQAAEDAEHKSAIEAGEAEDVVQAAFSDVWHNLRTEFTTQQLRDSSSSNLPQVKSNIRKSIETCNLSTAYKKLLISDIEEAESPISLLDKINRYLLSY